MYGGYEQCDDGNALSGDGCSSACLLEPNYACDYVGMPCQPVVCGDGLQQSYVRPDGSYAYEHCDDGNVVAADGCSSACELEPGWICDQPGVACREPECGDGRQDSWFVPGPGGGMGGSGGMGPGGTYYSEECDDGNAVTGDGCSSACDLEPGWICDQPGVACREPECGDGRQDSWFVPDPGGGVGGTGSGGMGPSGTYYSEECDDGNVVSGDGCGASCTVDAGWLCFEPGTPCRQPVCGDGFVDFVPTPGGAGGSGSGGTAGSSAGGFGGGMDGYYEGCDDGGTVPGDGCDASCAVEAGWSCPYWAGPCHIIVCGDGWADYPEEDCDDANGIPNDGCTNCRYDGTGMGGSGAGGFSSGFGGSGGFGG